MQPRNTFEATLLDGRWRLRYTLQIAPNKADLSVECSIQDSAHLQLTKGFGLFPCLEEDRKGFKGQPGRLAACTEEETVNGKATIKIRRVNGFSDQECGSYVTGRGFKPKQSTTADASCKDQFIPDYANLAARAAGPLQHCGQALSAALGGDKDEWLAFFQAMQRDDSGLPAPVEDFEETAGGRRKWIAGLLQPSQVMIQDRGDCDSKALTFASMQQDRRHLILFRSASLACDVKGEGHAFVGVEADISPYPRRYKLEEVLPQDAIDVDEHAFEQGDLVINGGILLKYKVMEVAGPGRTLFGEFDPQKYGRYLVIPLDREERAARRKAS